MSIINSIQIHFLIHYCKFCIISISWNIQNMSNLSCESINIHLIETIKMLFRQFLFKFTGNCCLSGCQKKYNFFMYFFLTNVLNHEMCAINLQLDVFVFCAFFTSIIKSSIAYARHLSKGSCYKTFRFTAGF